MLREGTVVHGRRIRPEDAAALQRLHRRLSERSVYLRFFQTLRELPAAQARDFAHVDGQDRCALVALDPQQPDEIIAVVRYDRDPGTARAEYAAVVEDRWQGRGLGLELTRWLIEVARRQGIRTLYALILPENGRMRQLFQRLGLPLRERGEQEGQRVDIDL